MQMGIILRATLTLIAGALLLAGGNSLAADNPPVAGAAPLAGQPADGYSDAELQEIAAPIALYPDDFLAQVMAASAFPEQLEAAKAWVAQNPGADAQQKINDQSWDLSVKIVAGFDSTLAMLNEYPDWRGSLAWAVENQQSEFMDAVQALRRQAQEAGNLQSTPEMAVTEERQVVVIKSPDPQVIYVPQYDPAVVYVTRPVTVVTPVIVYPPPVRVVWIPTTVYYNRYACNWWGGGISVGVWRPGWSVNVHFGRTWRPPPVHYSRPPYRPPPGRAPGRPTQLPVRPPNGGRGGRPPAGGPALLPTRPPGTRPPPSGGGLRPPPAGSGRPSALPARPDSTPKLPSGNRPGNGPAARPMPSRPAGTPRPAPSTPRPAPRPAPMPARPAQTPTQRPASPTRSPGSFNPGGGGGNAVRPGNAAATRAAADRGAASRGRK